MKFLDRHGNHITPHHSQVVDAQINHFQAGETRVALDHDRIDYIYSTKNYTMDVEATSNPTTYGVAGNEWYLVQTTGPVGPGLGADGFSFNFSVIGAAGPYMTPTSGSMGPYDWGDGKDSTEVSYRVTGVPPTGAFPQSLAYRVIVTAQATGQTVADRNFAATWPQPVRGISTSVLSGSTNYGGVREGGIVRVTMTNAGTDGVEIVSSSGFVAPFPADWDNGDDGQSRDFILNRNVGGSWSITLRSRDNSKTWTLSGFIDPY